VYTNHAWLTKVPHFKNTPRQFCVEIASVLSRHLFVPNETVIRYGSVATEIFFVTKGIAAGNNRLYTVGHLLGSEVRTCLRRYC
jgi:signal-transduction protein with cAMP-binding, CBS, and nucleotidyltransferase domain